MTDLDVYRAAALIIRQRDDPEMYVCGRIDDMIGRRNEGATVQLELRPGWYSENTGNFDLQLPGIYQWTIFGAGIYVGKAKQLRQRINDYPRNVRHMLEGQPWHGNPNKEFRPIHHALLRAYNEGIAVSISILETCEPDARNEKKRFWIQLRRKEAETGGLQLLNSD